MQQNNVASSFSVACQATGGDKYVILFVICYLFPRLSQQSYRFFCMNV